MLSSLEEEQSNPRADLYESRATRIILIEPSTTDALELSCPVHKPIEKLLEEGLRLFVGEVSCRIKALAHVANHDL